MSAVVPSWSDASTGTCSSSSRVHAADVDACSAATDATPAPARASTSCTQPALSEAHAATSAPCHAPADGSRLRSSSHTIAAAPRAHAARSASSTLTLAGRRSSSVRAISASDVAASVAPMGCAPASSSSRTHSWSLLALACRSAVSSTSHACVPSSARTQRRLPLRAASCNAAREGVAPEASSFSTVAPSSSGCAQACTSASLRAFGPRVEAASRRQIPHFCLKFCARYGRCPRARLDFCLAVANMYRLHSGTPLACGPLSRIALVLR
mmetsp:Transcript_28056/g.85718  ORF Transcript_28056/g.85718 Transcript_28056/m.85718 type:complete len:269 (-) Transcript_28056:1151-1957(-)